MSGATKVVEAARNLRKAQNEYMAHRGDNELGRAVGECSSDLDDAIAEYDKTKKPVVHCKCVLSMDAPISDGSQRANLLDVKDHPVHGDMDWAHTSRIVSIETKNTIYILGDDQP